MTNIEKEQVRRSYPELSAGDRVIIKAIIDLIYALVTNNNDEMTISRMEDNHATE